MIVQLFRLVIEGTDEGKLNAIKSWLDTKIEKNDLDANLASRGVSVYTDHTNSNKFILFMELNLKSTVNKSKYRETIEAQFISLNKTGLTLAYIDKVDDCSYDSENPQPYVVTRVMEWPV